MNITVYQAQGDGGGGGGVVLAVRFPSTAIRRETIIYKMWLPKLDNPLEIYIFNNF